MTNHLKMHSLNKIDENTAKIAKLFPNCVTEAKDANGETVHKIDFDLLKQELSSSIVEGREERYQFTWPDKKKAILTANAPINKTLRPCRNESVDFDNTQNLYIEGDNLEVLKLLQETYLGKIKMIYIDPPYNTGNDFVYEDDFRTENLEFRAESGNYDEEGNLLVDRMTLNTESNGRFHTDWLNMIYPRLKLARDLLSDDGVIFISIDDNEVDNLSKICTEVFGESNFICKFIWKSKLGKVGTTSTISTIHEYILCFAKNALNVQFKMIKNESDGRKENLRQWGVADRREDRPSMYYPITLDGIKVYPIKEDGSEGRWRVGEEMAKQLLKDGVLELKETNGMYNIYRNFPAGFSFTPYDTLLLDNIGTTSKGAASLKALGLEKKFDFSKPVELLSHFVSLITSQSSKLSGLSSDIILDFFSGSATTAHAVMQLNAEEKQNLALSIENLDKNSPDYASKLSELSSKLSQTGNRKFIMVQLPELCDEKSEAYKAGYKNICEIGKERIRRAGDQILELSIKNLEKEGIIEKIDNTKLSDLRSKFSPEGVIEKNAGKLSETRSLEEVYGLSGISLLTGKEVAKGRTLCTVGSDEEGSSINSVEHSGGAVQGESGVHTLSQNSKGLSGRTGDSIIDMRTLELLNQRGYKIKLDSIGGNQQNDLFSNPETNISTLNSKLSELSSKLKVLSSDTGFRVLKCDTSNMEDVYYTPDHLDKQDLFKSNIKGDRSAEDLLFQVMLDLGIMLSSKIEIKEIAGKTVYFVEGTYLAACFDQDITEETVTAIAKLKPYYFVTKDSSLASDSLATNFEQIFATFSPETIRKVL